MKKTNESWTVEEFLQKKGEINYPEYQREPNVWKLDKKRRLIDSMLRGIDISSIYLFKTGDSSFDCIDGRQRLNSILSFVGQNEIDEEDNNFHLSIQNEIYDDKPEFKELNDKRFTFIPESYRSIFFNYKISIVVIEEVESELELNLFFLRLQLGQILNSGEKLHAMVGDMRDTVFLSSLHPIFEVIRIPYRRFAKQQVYAQIILNYFSKKNTNEYHRSRYIDLQQFFKEKTRMDDTDRKRIEEINLVLDKIMRYFRENLNMIYNRATAVSVFLYVNKLISDGREGEIEKFFVFYSNLIRTIKWQIPKGLEMDQEYHYIFSDFYNFVTQAADEKRAIEKREEFLEREYYYYNKHNELRGDEQFQSRTGKRVDNERSSIVF